MVKYLQTERTFAALGDRHRLAILDKLSDGEASVSELAAPLGLSLPAITKHLRVLQANKMITTRKVGRVRTCRLSPKPLEDAEAWIQHRRRLWERRLDLLERELSLQEGGSGGVAAPSGTAPGAPGAAIPLK
jgi:DNA-binding transcriptional ArsR family regulator